MAETLAAHGGGLGIPEVPNLVTLMARLLDEHPLAQWLHTWQDVLFAWGVIAGLGFLAWVASRRVELVPRGMQNFVELLVEGLDTFVCGMMGQAYGRHFTPFIGTLFLYIWVMNLSALLPGYKSATANLNTTLGLALCVFCYVQYTGLRLLGFKGLFHHLVGSPDSAAAWIVGIAIILPVQFMVELIHPVSLSLRLFGNITGEDALMASFVQMGLGGLALQLFAKGLATIFSTVQALVFATLSAIYIALLLPHEAEHEPAASGEASPRMDRKPKGGIV